MILYDLSISEYYRSYLVMATEIQFQAVVATGYGFGWQSDIGRRRATDE